MLRLLFVLVIIGGIQTLIIERLFAIIKFILINQGGSFH